MGEINLGVYEQKQRKPEKEQDENALGDIYMGRMYIWNAGIQAILTYENSNLIWFDWIKKHWKLTIHSEKRALARFVWDWQ